MQLIPPVLSDKQISCRVNGKAFGIAYSGRETIGRRKFLIGLAGIVAPYTATRLQFRAGVRTRNLRLAVLWLAGIGRGSDVHIHRSILADDERMHRMVAAEGQ